MTDVRTEYFESHVALAVSQDIDKWLEKENIMSDQIISVSLSVDDGWGHALVVYKAKK
jgi:hypothetical protein